MNDDLTPPESDDGNEFLDHIMAERPEPTPEVADALAQVKAARDVVEVSLDELSDATQSALDVPAKIRRNPVRTALLIGGAGFLIAGGPRRAARYVVRSIRPDRPDPHAGLLPPDIEEILKDSGVAKDPEVRRALNKDFAEYLKKKGEYGPEPGSTTSFWRTFDLIAGPLGTVGARIMVQRLMEAERSRANVRAEIREEQLREASTDS